MKNMVIMRGWPSIGKSYLAKLLKQKYDGHNNPTVILSTDEYFVKDGKYIFDKYKLYDAHLWNQQRTAEYCYLGYHLIIDNTNTTFNEILPYLKIAKSYNYWVTEVIPNTEWKDIPEECFLRNQHKVPLSTIKAMMERFQPNLQPRIMEYLLNEDSI